jgi:hypothetical protein
MNNNSNVIVNTFNKDNKYLTSANFESFITNLDTSNINSFNVNTFNQNNKYFTSTNFERFVEGLLKVDLIIHKNMLNIQNNSNKRQIIIDI